MEAMEVDESLKTKMLAEDINVDHSIIVCYLKKPEKVWNLGGKPNFHRFVAAKRENSVPEKSHHR